MKVLSPKSWLVPPVSAECALKLANGQKRSWLQPPVATQGPPGYGVAAPKRTKTTGSTWVQPSPGISEGPKCKDSNEVTACQADEPHSTSEATVELTLSCILVATTIGTARISELRGVQAARLGKIFKSACGAGSSTSSVSSCLRCTGAINMEDAILFCALFFALTRDEKVNLLHGLYAAANLKDHESTSRLQWCFLGQPVCVRRLTSILGLSKRTLYNRVLAALYSQLIFNCSCLDIPDVTCIFFPVDAHTHLKQCFVL